MKLTIKQNNTAEQVTSPLIDKLYLLSSGGTLTQDSTLEGVLSTQTAYQDAVSYLQERFSGLTINALNYYIRFADPNVLSILLSAGFGDGTGITTSEAANINLGTLFKDNKNIVSFSELRYFTTTLKDGAFTRCSNLEEIDVSNRTIIPKETFYQCSKLKKFSGHNSVEGELDLPNLIQIGGINPFEKCSQLTTIVSLGQVTSLPASCFNTCTALDTVYQSVFDKLTTIGSSAFFNCPIEHIIQSDNTDSSVLYIPNLVGNLGNSAFQGIKITGISSLGSITSIGSNVFQNCTNLATINIPNGVTSIGSAAFANCTALININIPSGVTSIGVSAFEGCSLLPSISIPISVTSIGGNAFHNCSSLTSISIPSGVTSIGGNAFWNCNNLVISNLDLPNLTSLGDGAFRTTKVQQVSDLGSVTSIPPVCFQSCSTLTSVVIPNTVASIGSTAFQNCTNLVNINFPNTITSVGTNAVDNTAWYNNQSDGGVVIGSCLYKYKGTCPGIYTIPSNIINVSSACFYGQSSLTGITSWPSSQNNIPSDCFRNSGLTSFDLTGIVTIEANAFRNSKLTSIVIPNSVTSLGSDCFSQCSNLSSITIGTGVTSLGRSIFSFCPSIETLVIPSNVKSLERDTLTFCTGLQWVRLESTTMVSLFSASCFDRTNDCIIYVPSDLVDTYKADPKWSSLASRIQAIPT